jgi:hypothetical protein
MSEQGRRRRTWTSWVLILLGVAYSGLLHFHRTLTGTILLDGILGVTLGLYICSHPAANLIDFLFYRRATRRPFPSRSSTLLWITLNMLVLLAGWLSIFIGTTQIVSRGD